MEINVQIGGILKRVCNLDVPQQKIKILLKFQSALKQTLSPCFKSTFFLQLRQRKLVMYQII